MTDKPHWVGHKCKECIHIRDISMYRPGKLLCKFMDRIVSNTTDAASCFNYVRQNKKTTKDNSSVVSQLQE